MSARTFSISWRALAASAGAGAVLALAPLAAGAASADTVSSTLGSVPVLGSALSGITSTVSGATTSVPVVGGLLSGGTANLPGTSSLPGIGSLPDPSTLPVVGTVLGGVTGGATSGVPALPDPSTLPVVGTVLGGVTSGLPGLPDPSTIPGVGPVLGQVSSQLPGGLPPLPIVSSGDPATNSNGPSGSSDPSGFATFGAPIPFQAASNAPATLPGGSLPFTGEPGWIHTAGAIAMGLAGLSALVAFGLRIARRRFA